MPDKPDKNEHPAWSLYDEMFIMRFNICYLECYLRHLKTINMWMEILLGVSTSSAVAGFWLWRTAPGAYTWETIGVIAVVIAIIKPILNITEKISKNTELVTDARTINHNLNTIYLSMKQSQEYKDEHKERLIAIMRDKGNFIKENKAGNEKKKISDQCNKSLKIDFPPKDFYVPEVNKP